MALSTLRVALRPGLFRASQSLFLARTSQSILMTRTAPMAISAQDEMRAFWKKNQEQKRPQSPWIVYRWQLPMVSSLTHRVTGVAMVTALYTFSVAVFIAPDTVPHYIDFLKGMELGPAVWFPLKFIAAFPLTFHTLNSLRHLCWDFYGGYEVKTQLSTGMATYGISTALAVLLAGFSYLM